MKTLLFLAFLLQSLAFAAPSQTYRSSDLYEAPSGHKWKWSTDLSIAVMKGTLWEGEDLIPHLKKMANIYKQCDLLINQINIYDLEVPDRLKDISNDNKSLKVLERLNVSDRPLMVLIKKSDMGDGIGFSFRERPDPEVFKEEYLPLLATAWVPEVVLTPEYLAARNPEYSTIAHEFGHILLNIGHTGMPVLMSSNPRLLNGVITPLQCKHLAKSPFVKAIHE